MYKPLSQVHETHGGQSLLMENGIASEDALLHSSGTSLNSGSSVLNNAGGSKAVLAALRALQDKIRRLELERGQAQEESSHLRQQMKHQEIEAEHSKQRELLALQKTLQESRNALDRAQTEKMEIEIRLSRLEDRNRELQNTLEETQTKSRQLEDEKSEALGKVCELNEKYKRADAEIQRLNMKDKGSAYDKIMISFCIQLSCFIAM